MRLSELCKVIGAKPCGDLSLEINQITNNSKEVKKNSLFICIPGLKTDGHNYAQEAIEKGAVALILEKDVSCQCTKLFVPNARKIQAIAGSYFYGNPTSLIELVGVTGTNGKTTITYMIEAIYKAAGINAGVIGTINHRYMNSVLPSERTTPDSLKLQRIFRDMVNAGVQAVVMEVSSHALDLNRVDGCEFESAILSNITHDHFDYHKDFNNYLQSKYKLFEITNMEGQKKNKKKIAVINSDDLFAPYFIEKITFPILTYGIDNPSDIRAYNITLGPNGCSFDLVVRENYLSRIDLNLPGRANVYNALAAIAYAYDRFYDIEIIKKGLKSLKNVPGRFEKINCGQPFTVILDYAHNPDGLTKLLTYCDKKFGTRRIAVFGCEGGKDYTKRSLMGEVAAENADISIITTDNMYSESPEEVSREIERGLLRRNKKIDKDYYIIPDRFEAIKTALEMAEEGDEVFVAGKGHETAQFLYDKAIPFNDKEVIIYLLQERQ